MAYEFKVAKLPPNPTKDDIKREIERLSAIKIDAKNDDTALKVILNSVYGVAGFVNFVAYHREVAQSITKESEMMIKFTMQCFNDYFKEVWPTDYDTHKKMGIEEINTIAPYNVVNYADTDSVFLVLDRVYETSNYPKRFIDFVNELYDIRLKKYMHDKLEGYINKHHGLLKKPNGDFAMILELEQICESVLWVAKKKYIKNPIYIDGAEFKPLEKIQVKGLELNQSSTPKFIRERLPEFIKYIMTIKGKNMSPHIATLTKMLRNVQEEFGTIELEQISKTERVGDYNKFVATTKGKIVLNPNCKPHVAGAAFFNFLIDKYGLKNKYDYIRSGDKVCYYYTLNNPISEVFAFIPGNFPNEFAPKIDKEVQFEKVFLGPLNNVTKALGMPKLKASLTVMPRLEW